MSALLRAWPPAGPADTTDLDGAAWDMPEDDYHADPWLTATGVRSLSSTTAKHLLPPSTPAHARYALDHRKHSDAFDFGSAVHGLVLGRGAGFAVVDAPSWATKAAKDARVAARGEGRIPLLRKDYEAAQAAADRVHDHEAASVFLRAAGASEVVLTWLEDGTPCRAMLDRWPDPRAGNPVIVDLKTTDATDTDSIARSMANYRYHLQRAWYGLAYERVHDLLPAFVFIFVEKTPPHEVRVVELDDDATARGRRLAEQALDIWRDCTSTNTWPGRPAGIELIGLPRWARRDTEEIGS